LISPGLVTLPPERTALARRAGLRRGADALARDAASRRGGFVARGGFRRDAVLAFATFFRAIVREAGFFFLADFDFLARGALRFGISRV